MSPDTELIAVTVYDCPSCGKRWTQEIYFAQEMCIYCGHFPVLPIKRQMVLGPKRSMA